MMNQSVRRALLLGSIGHMLAGCASTAATTDNVDPLEKINRVVYRMNDLGDRYLAEPVATVYRDHTPGALRQGLGNVLGNLRYPITIVNDFLQGKFRQGGADLSRFLLNSTVGLGGLFDPAATIGLRENDEDLGQTLATWGVPQGPYLVLPLFGPYTLTSGLGDLAVQPLNLMNSVPSDDAVLVAWTGDLIHRRAALLEAGEEVRKAFDPYIFVRDAYLQNLNYRIHDGDVPEDELFPESELDEADDATDGVAE